MSLHKATFRGGPLSLLVPTGVLWRTIALTRIIPFLSSDIQYNYYKVVSFKSVQFGLF
jgi:hypothetical protein